MRRQRLSERLWGVHWSSELPLRLTADGVVVEWVDFSRANAFVKGDYADIFEQDETSPFSGGKLTPARGRYYEEAGDFFVFSKDGADIGLLVGTPVDWSTYYIRSSAVKREYQGRALVQKFLPWLFERLKAAGVERIEAETAPSNMASVYWLTRQRFNVTGTVFSERWGAMTRFTKFLCEDSEAVFLRQFCMGVHYQAKERKRRPGGEEKSPASTTVCRRGDASEAEIGQTATGGG